MAQLTQAEYARHRKECGLDGGSHQAVQKAINVGRISYVQDSKLIDPEEADRDWAQNTEPRPKADTASKSKGAPADDYNISRGRREFYESELSRLKVEEKRGKLIPVDVVRKVLYEAARIIRAGHEDIVSQLAPDLASETNIAATERILKTRFDRLDTDLAARVENLDESLITGSQEEEE